MPRLPCIRHDVPCDTPEGSNGQWSWLYLPQVAIGGAYEALDVRRKRAELHFLPEMAVRRIIDLRRARPVLTEALRMKRVLARAEVQEFGPWSGSFVAPLS